MILLFSHFRKIDIFRRSARFLQEFYDIVRNADSCKYIDMMGEFAMGGYDSKGGYLMTMGYGFSSGYTSKLSFDFNNTYKEM